MKLSDIVSAAGLASYAEIALVLFLLAFLGVVVSLFLPSRQRTYERMRHIALDPDSPESSVAEDTPHA
jgi:cbb3-type cytochrome oxidase subunit 3